MYKSKLNSMRKTLTKNKIELVTNEIRKLESWRSVFNIGEYEKVELYVKEELSFLLNKYSNIDPLLINEIDEIINKKLKVKIRNLIILFSVFAFTSGIAIFQGSFLIGLSLIAFPLLDMNQRSLSIYQDLQKALKKQLFDSFISLRNDHDMLIKENENKELKIQELGNEYNSSLNQFKREYKDEIASLVKSIENLSEKFDEQDSTQTISVMEDNMYEQVKGLNWKHRFYFLYITGAFDAIHNYFDNVQRRTDRMIHLLMGIKPDSAHNYVKVLSKYGIEGCPVAGEDKFLVKINHKIIELALAYVNTSKDPKNLFE